jgi:hypothetical protein
MAFEKRLIERLDQLITKADDVLATHTPNPPNVIGFPTLSNEKFQQRKASSENIVKVICGAESSYLQNFIKETKRGAHRGCVNAGKGILLAVKEDVEAGMITSVKSLAEAEVFTDFVEIADHLLKQGYKDPSASLIGAVLEDSLRKLAENSSISIKSSDDISALNNKLADKEIYSRLIQKQIHAWKGIRDSADHGKFSEYKTEDVKDMISGVSRFITEYQA